jgi:hypothetical protein
MQSEIIETLQHALAKMDAETQRRFVGAAYENIVGYDLFEDCPAMSTAEGTESLVCAIEEHETHGNAEHCRYGIAAALQSL